MTGTPPPPPPPPSVPPPGHGPPPGRTRPRRHLLVAAVAVGLIGVLLLASLRPTVDDDLDVVAAARGMVLGVDGAAEALRELDLLGHPTQRAIEFDRRCPGKFWDTHFRAGTRLFATFTTPEGTPLDPEAFVATLTAHFEAAGLSPQLIHSLDATEPGGPYRGLEVHTDDGTVLVVGYAGFAERPSQRPLVAIAGVSPCGLWPDEVLRIPGPGREFLSTKPGPAFYEAIDPEGEDIRLLIRRQGLDRLPRPELPKLP